MANTDIQSVSEDTPAIRLFEVLRDDVMVSLSEGVSVDPQTGQEHEATRSEVAHEGDQYDNLSRVLIDKIDNGLLGEVFRELDQSERKEAEPADSSPPADEEDPLDIDSATAEELAAETSRLEIKVIGTGAGGNVLKQDHQKALRDYYASRPGA